MTDRITSPFGNFTPAREVVAGHDLSGKVAIVTGSASGIGVETARALAEAGAEVVLAVRNGTAGAEVAADIAKTAKGPAPRVELVDLSDFASIRAFGQRAAKLGLQRAKPDIRQRVGHTRLAHEGQQQRAGQAQAHGRSVVGATWHERHSNAIP